MAEDNFDPTETLGPEFGGINQPTTDPESFKPFEGAPLTFPGQSFVTPNYNADSARFVKGNTQDISKGDKSHAISNLFQAIAQTPTKNKGPKIFSYDASADGGAFYKRYAAYGDEKFASVGFSPLRDNEAIFNARTSNWDDWSRMMTNSFFPLFGTGFISGPKSMWQMMNGNFSEDTGIAEDYAEKAAIGQSSKGGLFGFFNNTSMSFAYTAGIVVETVLEEVAAALLIPETGGASEVLVRANTARKVGKVVDAFETGYKAVEATKVATSLGKTLNNIDNISSARSFWDAAISKTGRFLNPFENITEAAYNIKKNEKNLQGLARLGDGIVTTAGGFYRDVRNVNMALSEARLEGGFVSNEMFDDLYQEYYDKHGTTPDEKELKKMRQAAKMASIDTVLWNTGLIFVSNKIVLPNIVGPRGGLGRFLGSKINEFKNLKGGTLVKSFNEKLLKSGRKYQAPKWGWEKDGLVNTLKGIRRNPVGKTIVGLGGYFKKNVMEGIQENLQDVISQTNKEYYTEIYKNPAVAGHLSRRGIWNAAMNDQYGAQGLETFASGFAMGAFAGPLNASFEHIAIGYNKMFDKGNYQAYKDARNNTGLRTAKTLTDLTSDPKEFYDSKLFNLAKQADASTTIAEGDERTSRDAREESFVNQIHTSLETDTFDTVMDNYADLKNLTAEEFEEALGYEAGEGAPMQNELDNIINKGRKLKKRYDSLNERFKDDISLEGLEQGTTAYKIAMLKKLSLKESKKNALFFGDSFDNVTGRMKSIMNKAMSELPMEKIDGTDLEVLFDEERMVNERELLNAEIQSRKLSDDPKAKREIKKKEAKLAAYSTYTDSLGRYRKAEAAAAIVRNEGGSEEDYELAMQRAKNVLEDGYKSYLKGIGELNDTHIFNDRVDESFNELYDFNLLSAEKKMLSRAVNELHDPAAFAELTRKNYIWMHDLYNKREGYYKEMVEQTQREVETNALLNHLADKQIYISAEALKDWMESNIIPTEFYDASQKAVISQGHPSYPEYLGMFFKAALLQESGKLKPDQALQAKLDELDEKMMAEINKLPTTLQRVDKDEIVRLKTKKLNIERVDSELNDGEYVEVTYLKNKKENKAIFYKDGEDLKYDNVEGAVVKLSDIKEKFESATKFAMEDVADPEQVKIIEDKYDDLKAVAYEEYRDEKGEAKDYLPNIIATTDNVNSIPADLRQQLFDALSKDIEENPDLYPTTDINDNSIQAFMTQPGGQEIINVWNEIEKEKGEAIRLGDIEVPVLVVNDKEVSAETLSDEELEAQINAFQEEINIIEAKEELSAADRLEQSRLVDSIANIKNYIIKRKYSDRSPAMNDAVEKILYLQSLQGTINKTADEEYYVIDGVRYGRVTKSYEGLKEYHFSVKDEENINADYELTLGRKLKKGEKESTVDDFIDRLKARNLSGFEHPTAYIRLANLVDALVKRTKIKKSEQDTETNRQIEAIDSEIKIQEEVGITQQFKEVYDELIKARESLVNQLPLTKAKLKVELIEGLGNITYEESRIRGNTLDAYVKKFFDQPGFEAVYNEETAEGMSEEAFNSMFGPNGFMTNLRNQVALGKYQIFSEGLVVWDKNAQSIDTDGNKTTTGVAGEIDLLVVDQEGNVMIVDIKTGDKIKKWDLVKKFGDKSSTLEEYRLQQSAYKNLLFNVTGLDASIHLLPIETKTSPEGKIISAKESDLIPSVLGVNNYFYDLVYDPKIEEIIPKTGPSIQAPIANEETTQSSTSVKEGVADLFESNPELANAVYEALGFKGNINLESNLENTGKTEQELVEYLKKKYPEIKLNITNNPIWEQGDNVFNQTIENEMGEGYWKELYSNKSLSNREEFESVRIPTIKNKYKPDYENVYHGTNNYHLDSDGNLILTPSYNFENKTESVSLTQIPVVAQDYMLRKQGNIIIKINNNALPSNYTIESVEEIAINGNKPFIVKKGMFEIIKVQTLAEKMKAKYANEVEQRAEELKARAKSDLNLLDAVYSERIAAANYSEIQEYENDSQREQAPDWYVPDEYLDSRAANKVYSDLKNKINKNWVIKTLSDLLIDKIKTTGEYIPSIESALDDISQYGSSNAPHSSTLWEELLNEIGLGFKQTYSSAYNTGEEITKARVKQKEKEDLIDKIEELVNNSEKSSMDFYNSKEQKEKREEQKRIDEENHKKWLQNLPKYRQEIDDLPFQKVNGKIIGQANIKAMSVLIDAVNKKADTIPHEYAHHYIAWFRDSAIVKEGIKRFGSEEALVQAIGEQVVKQKGEAYNWWKKFTNFILNLLSDKQLLQVLTDSFLNRQDLNDFTYNQITPQQEQQAQQLYSQYLDTKQPNVILPIGTSGSGKSTFIKSLPKENLVVIEPDAMRVEFTGDINNKSKDKEIYIEAANRAVQAIKQGKQVVFDTTNLTKDKRLPFIEAIKKAIPTVNIQYKLMELNPELAKQRIKTQIARGENRANVPDSTIDRHAESYKQMLEDIKNEPITEYKELGSKQDIEGFKEFATQPSTTSEMGEDLPFISPEEFGLAPVAKKKNMLSLEEATTMVNNATSETLPKVKADLNAIYLEKRISDENLNLISDAIERRTKELENAVNIDVSINNINVGDELIVKNPIFTKQKEWAEIDTTVIVKSIIGDKVKIQKYGSSSVKTLNADELGEYLTTIGIEEAKSKVADRPLDKEDKVIIKEGLDALSAYINSKLDLDKSEKNAESMSTEDVRNNLYDDLEC